MNISKTRCHGLILDEHLTFKYLLVNSKLKLSIANSLLSKIGYFIKFPLLRTIYYAFLIPTKGMAVKYGYKNKVKLLKRLKGYKIKHWGY